MSKIKSADEYVAKHKKWQRSLDHLRELIKRFDLVETIKWGQPTYTINNKNVLAICAFKEHFGIWFFNGALLKDPDGYLRNAQEGTTKAMRQLRFSSFEEINDEVITNFVQQAINNQKAGKEVKIDINREADIPPLLEKAFSDDKKLNSKFGELTPGRQREYAQYIADAKQEATKLSRLKKIIPMIKNGVGLNDKYQK
ncbi:MAG TPA: DUF1801 domain-containing protein [Gracilimonas sp.]|uniref:YdeI/OmpD-associated family protein n=1 Tax=Gracilimonas sp. TaxID=1974203 RepID=UPI002D93D952|nr:DUF1801 domain-containing protein [Gracilimonas sp.]